LKLNETHQFLLYADDADLQGDNLNIIRKNTEFLIDSSYDVGLEVNTEKAKYMLMSQFQSFGQNHNM
jgi:hypothetical protein